MSGLITQWGFQTKGCQRLQGLSWRLLSDSVTPSRLIIKWHVRGQTSLTLRIDIRSVCNPTLASNMFTWKIESTSTSLIMVESALVQFYLYNSSWTMLNLQTRPKIPPGVCNSRWHSAVDEGCLRATYGQGTWQRHVPGFQPWCDNVWHHFRVISSKAGFSSTEIDSLEESLKARGKLQRAIGWWHRERERERKRESAAWMWVTDAVCEFNWLQHHFVIANQEMFGHYDKDGSGDIDSFEARKATLHWRTIHTHTHVGVSSTNFEIPPSCFHRFFV